MYSILIMGIGGDGAQTIGKILAIACELEGYAVSFYPFYGSQMRGGESSCVIKIDTEKEIINNPTLNKADYFLVLNDAYLNTYGRYQKKNTKILTLSSEEKAEKNFNLIMFRKFAMEVNLFKKVTVENAIAIKFHKNNKEDSYHESCTIL